MEFRKDVVVDIICFRKLGHNEQDTPSLTQPLMYKKIGQHPGTRKLYADRLAAQGLGDTLGDDMVQGDYRAAMDAGKHTVDRVLTNFKSKYAVDWSPLPRQEVDGRWRHRYSAGRVEAFGRAHHDHSRIRHAAPAGQEGLRRPRRHGPGRAPGGLGHG